MPAMTLAKTSLPVLLILACVSGPASADTLYKCTDAEGHATYTNNKSGAKNCIVISRDQPVSTIASPRARSSASAPTPCDFPKVGAGEQKSRDGDRRAILDQELATEHKNLEEAKKSLSQQEAGLASAPGTTPQRAQERLKPYQDTVALHERNIEALKKEIANLK